MTSKIAEFCRSVDVFCIETVQWRRPVASAIYLLATNAVFWAGAFYGEHMYQFSFLVCISISMFVGHVVFPFILIISSLTKQSSNVSERLSKFSELDAKDKALQCGKLILISPISLVILPMFYVLHWITMEKFVEYTVMVATAGAAYLLQFQQIERACWVSYLTALFMLSVPPWRYNKVTEQITDNVESTCTAISSSVNRNFIVPFRSTFCVIFEFLKYYCLGYWIPPLLRIIKQNLLDFARFIHETFLLPIYRFYCSLKAAFIYVFFGYWIPPLVDYICRKLYAFKHFVLTNIVDPIKRFLSATKEILVYWFCGYWIPPLLEIIGRKLNDLKQYVRLKFVDPVVVKLIALKNFLVYWFGGYWIPPFKQYCWDCKQRALNWWQQKIVEPVVDFFNNFTENMTYILLGRWIPGFINYLYNSCLIPFFGFCVRCKNVVIYIVYGYWIPDLLAFLRTKRDACIVFIKENYLIPFKLYMINTGQRITRYLLEMKEQIRIFLVEKYIQLKQWLADTKIRIKNYLILTRKRLKRYIICDVWIPFKKFCRRSWIKFKFFVKYRIVFPIIRNSILAVIYFCEWAFVSVAKPLLGFLYEQSIHVCGYMWYYYGDPGWHWLSERLPEKSPFVEDSDTELKDYLPSAEQEVESSASDEEELPTERGRGFADNNYSRTPSSSSLEEAEFSQNLEIPAFEQADSDEEQEREMMPVSRPTKLRTSIKRSHKTADNENANAQQKDDISQLTPKTPTSPLRELSNALTTAASFAMLKATIGASFVSSQVSSIMSNESRNEESTFEADLEPDFELVEHSDVEE